MIVHCPDEISLRKIADSGQCFRWTRAGDGWLIPDRQRLLFVRQPDPHTLEPDCPEAEFLAVWKDYFDLDTDYGAIRSRVSREADPFLYEAIEDQRGIRILRQDAWEMLITSIITQNRNIPAIRRSVELLAETAGTACCDKGRSFFAFPSPDQLDRLPDDGLAACKLGYRTRYIRSAARAVASGAFNPDGLADLGDEDCLGRLLALDGVGVKVASCVMLFGLHRLDALPEDVWVRRIWADKYPQGYPRAVYAPYNGVYQQYMFEYYRKRAAQRPADRPPAKGGRPHDA